MTWKTAWQQSSIILHQNCGTVNICFRGPACTLLWRPAALWLEHFAFSHHSLARSPPLHPTTANLLLPITRLPMPSARPLSALWKIGSLSFQSSEATFPLAALSQVLLEIEMYRSLVFCRFFFFFQPGAPTKKQMVHLFCFYYKHVWIILLFQIQSYFVRFPYGVVHQ